MSVLEGSLFQRPLHDLEPSDAVTPRQVYLWLAERKIEHAELCRDLLAQGPHHAHRTAAEAEEWIAHLTRSEQLCKDHAAKWQELAAAQPG